VIQVVYLTLVAIGLYFAADWLLDRIERARGERFKNRQVVFFGIILLLALITFQLIDRLSVPG
jgi:predicted PurR-regulated permease PerM